MFFYNFENYIFFLNSVYEDSIILKTIFFLMFTFKNYKLTSNGKICRIVGLLQKLFSRFGGLITILRRWELHDTLSFEKFSPKSKYKF